MKANRIQVVLGQIKLGIVTPRAITRMAIQEVLCIQITVLITHQSDWIKYSCLTPCLRLASQVIHRARGRRCRGPNRLLHSSPKIHLLRHPHVPLFPHLSHYSTCGSLDLLFLVWVISKQDNLVADDERQVLRLLLLSLSRPPHN